MNCSKARRLIQDCLDGAATPAERQRLDEHLERCPSCARVLEESRRLVHLLASVPRRSLSASFEEKLRAAVRDLPPSRVAGWRERLRFRLAGRVRFPALMAAGGLAAALAAGFVSLRPNPPHPSAGLIPGERDLYVAAAIERHRELAQENPGSDWDPVYASVALSSGGLLNE